MGAHDRSPVVIAMLLSFFAISESGHKVWTLQHWASKWRFPIKLVEIVLLRTMNGPAFNHGPGMADLR
jgi:hypothetical protein